MRNYFFVWLLLCFVIRISAQQNFFNVPSFETTAPGKIFVQEQLNINQIYQSNFTFDYGLKNGFQVGFNVVGVDFYESHHAFANNQKDDKDIFAPLFMVNAQKNFELTPYFNIALGADHGVTVDFTDHSSAYAHFNYAVVGTKFLKKRVVLTGGGYFGNAAYFQEKNAFGVMAGLDADLYKNKIHLVADWISGSTPVSVAVLGLSFFINDAFPISIGWQLPNVEPNASAIVLEFTWNPSLKK